MRVQGREQCLGFGPQRRIGDKLVVSSWEESVSQHLVTIAVRERDFWVETLHTGMECNCFASLTPLLSVIVLVATIFLTVNMFLGY